MIALGRAAARMIPALALLALGAAPLAAEDDRTVRALVFEAGLLDNVEPSQTLSYRFTLEGRDIEPTYEGPAQMRLEASPSGDGFDAYFDLYEEPHRRRFGPIGAATQNPMVLVFLQNDARTVANLTGGSERFFQERLRRALSEPAMIEPVDIELDGETVTLDKATITPFADDPFSGRLPQMVAKIYEFWVGDAVPGGIYQLRATTPLPESDEIIVRETLTFERVAPSAEETP